jgi:ribonucleoside-diphosphate reductase alpha chain
VQRAQGRHGRRDPRRLPAGPRAGPEGDGDLSRRLQVAELVAEARSLRALLSARPGADLVAAPTATEYVRHRLPATRRSVTHKLSIQGTEGYFTVGLFADGRPGELFITMAKEGSTVGGLMDTIGTLVSICLQSGVPVETLVAKFAHVRFAPDGMTRNGDIPFAKSVVDYIFRWLGMEFVPGYWEANSPQARLVAERTAEVEAAVAAIECPTHDALVAEVARRRETRPVDAPPAPASPPVPAPVPAPVATPAGMPRPGSDDPLAAQRSQFAGFQTDAPACPGCGAITVRNGACYRCFQCGESLGCS